MSLEISARCRPFAGMASTTIAGAQDLFTLAARRAASSRRSPARIWTAILRQNSLPLPASKGGRKADAGALLYAGCEHEGESRGDRAVEITQRQFLDQDGFDHGAKNKPAPGLGQPALRFAPCNRTGTSYGVSSSTRPLPACRNSFGAKSGPRVVGAGTSEMYQQRTSQLTRRPPCGRPIEPIQEEGITLSGLSQLAQGLLGER